MKRNSPVPGRLPWRRTFALATLFVLAPGVEAHRIGHAASGPDHGTPGPAYAPAEVHHDDLLAMHGPAPDRVRALIDRYHTTGDDRLLDAGWAALKPALDEAQIDPATLLAAAWLAQAGHEFARAERYLRHVELLRPDHGEAWLLQASISLVQGDVEGARDACRRTTLTVPVVVTAACFARVDAHEADAAELRYLSRRFAATLTAQEPANSDLLGWLHGVAADLAARGGLLEDAERHYRTALALTPTVTLRAGYADVLLETGRAGEVLDVVKPSDTAPALVLRRVLAQQQLGQAPASELESIDLRFQRWIDDDDLRHAREMALFYLRVQPDPALAFGLAERNYRVQREPEDRALLCETAAAVGVPVKSDCPTGVRGLLPGPTVSSVHGH